MVPGTCSNTGEKFFYSIQNSAEIYITSTTLNDFMAVSSNQCSFKPHLGGKYFTPLLELRIRNLQVNLTSILYF